jgi:hypothetical protein
LGTKRIKENKIKGIGKSYFKGINAKMKKESRSNKLIAERGY